MNFSEIKQKLQNAKDEIVRAADTAVPVIVNEVTRFKEEKLPVILDKIDIAADKTLDAVDDLKYKAALNPEFAVSDISRDEYMLNGKFATHGYDWWWHNFTGRNPETGEEKSFFVEFFAINPGLAEDVPVFGQLPENKELGKKPSYLMVKAGAWGENAKQIHRFFAWKDVNITPNAPYMIEADDCLASEGRISGSVSVSEEEAAAHPEYMSDAGTMKWNLTIDKQIAYNVGYGASAPMRRMEAFEMYWHAEGMKTEYAGEVELDGVKYLVIPETSYGYADKNWGADFTSPWIWLSSNNLYSKTKGCRLQNSVFDIGGGKPCVAGFELKDKLLGGMYYEGEQMEFNFSKVWMDPKIKFNCGEKEDEIFWHIELQNSAYVMITDVTCKKADMLLVNYEAPSGLKLHNRLWNGGNGEGTVKLFRKAGAFKELIDEIECRNIGCEWGEFDV